MQRREFIAGLGSAAACLVACAHRGGRRSCHAGRGRLSGARIYGFAGNLHDRWVPRGQSGRLCAGNPTKTMTGGAAEDLPEQCANGVPRDDRNHGVRHQDSQNQQKSPSPSQFAWEAVLTCRTCGRQPGVKEFVDQKSSYKIQLHCRIAIPQPFQTCTLTNHDFVDRFCRSLGQKAAPASFLRGPGGLRNGRHKCSGARRSLGR